MGGDEDEGEKNLLSREGPVSLYLFNPQILRFFYQHRPVNLLPGKDDHLVVNNL